MHVCICARVCVHAEPGYGWRGRIAVERTENAEVKEVKILGGPKEANVAGT